MLRWPDENVDETCHELLCRPHSAAESWQNPPPANDIFAFFFFFCAEPPHLEPLHIFSHGRPGVETPNL